MPSPGAIALIATIAGGLISAVAALRTARRIKKDSFYVAVPCDLSEEAQVALVKEDIHRRHETTSASP